VHELQCLGNPRVVPCFRWHSVSTCCPLGSREAHRLLAPSSFTHDAGLRPKRKVSALPISHTPILVRGFISGLTYGSLSLRPVDLLAPLVGADQAFTQPTGTFTSGLSTVWSPAPAPDITTETTGQFPLAGLFPLEHQLASLQPLIEPDWQFSRIRLSEKVSRGRPRKAGCPRTKLDEPKLLMQGGFRISFGRRPSYLVLGTQPLAQPSTSMSLYNLVGSADRAKTEIVSPSNHHTIECLYHCFLVQKGLVSSKLLPRTVTDRSLQRPFQPSSSDQKSQSIGMLAVTWRLTT
jgi:hypothetical protein